jgi:hypothetical protein
MRLLGTDAASASKVALDISFAHVSISTSFGSNWVDGSLSSRLDWNLTQSVRP